MFRAVIAQGCEAERASEHVNRRGWELETHCGEFTAESSLRQSRECPFFSGNPKGWRSYLHPTFQRPKVLQDITEPSGSLI